MDRRIRMEEKKTFSCFWINNKECSYLENNIVDRVDTTPKVTYVGKKDIPMLDNFSIDEICHNCLIATYITLRSRI